MSTQSLDSYLDIRFHQNTGLAPNEKSSTFDETKFSRIAFATAVGIGFAASLAAFLYPVYMHLFYYDY